MKEGTERYEDNGEPMSIIKGVRGIKREDLPADAPSWVDSLLTPLNMFMDTTVTALRNGLNHRDNMRATLRKFTFTTAVELEINHKYNGMVGIDVLYCEDFYKKRERQIDNDTVGVTLKFDTSTTEEVTFAIIADIKVV